MFASRAFAIDCVTGFIRIGHDPDPPLEGPRTHPLIRALGPALETAFGIEHDTLFPDEIRVLVEALPAGPLGDEMRPMDRVLDLA